MDEQTKEILTILQEEAAEVIVAISKCFRFSPDQIMKGQDLTNMQYVEKEIGDLQAMIQLLVKQRVGVTQDGIHLAKQQKFEKLKIFSNIKITK